MQLPAVNINSASQKSAFQFDVEKFLTAISQLDDAFKKERENALSLERLLEEERIKYKAALYEASQNLKDLYGKFELIREQSQKKDQQVERVNRDLSEALQKLQRESQEASKMRRHLEDQIRKVAENLQKTDGQLKEESERFRIQESIQGSKIKFLTQEINRRTRILKEIHHSREEIKKVYTSEKVYWGNSERKLISEMEKLRVSEQNLRLQHVQAVFERDVEKEKLAATSKFLQESETECAFIKKDAETARTRNEILENEMAYLREKWAYQTQMESAKVSALREIKKETYHNVTPLHAEVTDPSRGDVAEKIENLSSLQDLLVLKRADAERIRREIEVIPFEHPKRRTALTLLEIVESQKTHLEEALDKIEKRVPSRLR